MIPDLSPELEETIEAADEGVRIDAELDALRVARPGAYRLALVLSPAARVERKLLRRARLLLGDIDPSADAAAAAIGAKFCECDITDPGSLAAAIDRAQDGQGSPTIWRQHRRLPPFRCRGPGTGSEFKRSDRR